jgi:hypothetical protein
MGRGGQDVVRGCHRLGTDVGDRCDRHTAYNACTWKGGGMGGGDRMVSGVDTGQALLWRTGELETSTECRGSGWQHVSIHGRIIGCPFSLPNKSLFAS